MEKRIIRSTRDEQNYIVGMGSFQCCPKEFKPIGDVAYFPTFGIWKVHEKYPVQISQGDSLVKVFPLLDKNMPIHETFPGPVYEKGAPAHDFAMFVIFPGDVNLDGQDFWKKVATIDDAFIKKDGKNEISVVYAEKRGFFDKCYVAVPVMKSQIWSFMRNCFLFHPPSPYFYREHEHAGHIEGKISIPYDKLSDLDDAMYEIIKKRFKI